MQEASSDDSKTSKRPGRWTAWAGLVLSLRDLGMVLVDIAMENLHFKAGNLGKSSINDPFSTATAYSYIELPEVFLTRFFLF